MKKALLFSVGLLLLTSNLNATVCTASVNGNWSSSSTWDCNHAPGNYDTMWVPNGFTVTVDINSPEYQGMLVIVDGILYFDNGQKINICNGGVYVSSSGILAGDNPGSKINICGQTVWVGPDSTYGPVTYGSVSSDTISYWDTGQTPGGVLVHDETTPGNDTGSFGIRIHNELTGSELKVYPNPATAQIYYPQVPGASEIEITDITGHICIRTQANVSGVVDISCLQPGVYILTIDNSSPTRFIKQ